MNEEELEEIGERFLRECPSHDLGLFEYGCNCLPSDIDYRPAMARLYNEVKRLAKTEVVMDDDHDLWIRVGLDQWMYASGKADHQLYKTREELEKAYGPLKPFKVKDA